MQTDSDTYRTLLKPSEEILFKEKKSKFYAYAFPIHHEDEVKPILEILKKKHQSAGHFCYALRLGVEQIRYRTNDDGEPNNSAGMPIYGQIQSFKVTNLLIVVARVYGGTKLGVGGLIVAYRTAARMALENANIKIRLIKDRFKLSFGYSNMNKVMRILKQRGCEIIAQKMAVNCQLIIAVRKSESDNFKNQFNSIHMLKIEKIVV